MDVASSQKSDGVGKTAASASNAGSSCPPESSSVERSDTSVESQEPHNQWKLKANKQASRIFDAQNVKSDTHGISKVQETFATLTGKKSGPSAAIAPVETEDSQARLAKKSLGVTTMAFNTMESNNVSDSTASAMMQILEEANFDTLTKKEMFKSIYSVFYEHHKEAVYAAERVAKSYVQKDEVEVAYIDKFGEKYFNVEKIGLRFDMVIMVVVVFNTIEIYVRTNDREGKHQAVCDIFSHIFAAIFLLELIVRLSAMRWTYFRYPHNWLDGLLASLAVLDTWIFPIFMKNKADQKARMMSVLRILRLLRIVRLMKVVRKLRPVWTLLRSMYAAVAPLLSALVLLFLVLFTFGIFMTQIVGSDNEFHEKLVESGFTDIDVRERFGSVEVSMLTLFGCVTDGCHDAIFAPLILVDMRMAIFVLVFVTFLIFGLTNILVGIFCETSMRVSSEFDDMMNLYLDQKSGRALIHLMKIWVTADKDASGRLSEEEFTQSVRDPESACALHDLGLSDLEIRDLFRTIDKDQDGLVTIKEFIDGMVKLRKVGSKLLSTYVLVTRLENSQKTFNERMKETESNLVESCSKFQEHVRARLKNLEESLPGTAFASSPARRPRSEVPPECPCSLSQVLEECLVQERDEVEKDVVAVPEAQGRNEIAPGHAGIAPAEINDEQLSSMIREMHSWLKKAKVRKDRKDVKQIDSPRPEADAVQPGSSSQKDGQLELSCPSQPASSHEPAIGHTQCSKPTK